MTTPSQNMLRMGLTLGLLLITAAAGFSQTPEPAKKSTPSASWRLLPIRPEAQFKLGQPGGEGMQHMHGMTRSLSNPDIIYMAHDCSHFWKSIDGGKTWRKPKGTRCEVRASQSIAADPVNPQIVLAVMDSAWNYLCKTAEGIYRSEDGGETWRRVLSAQGRHQRFHQRNIDFDPKSLTDKQAMRWYAGLPNDAIYRSDDGGKTWRKQASLNGHQSLYAVAAHPADGKTVYLASQKGLFASHDRGKTLAPLGDLPAGEISSLAAESANPNRLWAVLKNKGLYRSEDAGKKFQRVKKHNALYVFLNPAHPNTLFLIGSENTSLASRDGGKTWREMTIKADPNIVPQWAMNIGGPFTGVAPDPRNPQNAVAYNRARFWRTADGGKTWTDSSTLFTGFAWGWGNNGAAFDRFAPDRFAFMCFDVGMVLTDNGGKWFSKRPAPWSWYQRKKIAWTGMYAGAFQPKKGSKIILATVGMYHQNQLIRSVDNGKTWSIVDTDRTNHLFLGFHPQDPDWAFSADKQSIDAGATWKPIPFLAEHRADIMGLCAARPNTLYAASREGSVIYRSDDRGKTWRQYVKADWQFNGMNSKQTFAVDPRNPNVVYTLGKDRDLARFDGKTWTSLGVLKLAGRKHYNYIVNIAFDPRRADIIYATSKNVGGPFLFRSRNNGKTWEDITGNLPMAGACGLAVNPHTGEVLYGGLGGTWILPPPYAGPTPIYDRAVNPAR